MLHISIYTVWNVKNSSTFKLTAGKLLSWNSCSFSIHVWPLPCGNVASAHGILQAASCSLPFISKLWSLPWPASLRKDNHLWLLMPRTRKQKMMPMDSFILEQEQGDTARKTCVFMYVCWLIHSCIPEVK